MLTHEEETAKDRSARVDAVLKKNMLQGVCISCHEPIFGNEPMLSTIHGPYHDAPKTCVEGRD